MTTISRYHTHTRMIAETATLFSLPSMPYQQFTTLTLLFTRGEDDSDTLAFHAMQIAIILASPLVI